VSNQTPSFRTIFNSIETLKTEVADLRTELARLERPLLNERIQSVEEALAQNRVLLFANQLEDELEEDVNKLTRADCKNKPQCVERFSKMASENLKIIRALKPKEAIADFDSKISNLGCTMEKAKGFPCELCHQNMQWKLKKERRAFQTVVLVEKPASDQQENDINIPFIVEKFLEPLANSIRLTILLNISEGKKNYSKLKQLTNLTGGHLIFHLKKLLDADLIAKDGNKGDYIITTRGIDAIKNLRSVQ
jgi:DNA-binding HxlR family transcriptional regulator